MNAKLTAATVGLAAGLLASFLILICVRHRSWQAALGLEKKSKRHDIQMDRTGKAKTDDGMHHDEACNENDQYANFSAVKPSSGSTAAKTRDSTECKSESPDTTSYEPLLNTNREVVQEATYDELKIPLNV
jgi:hypothetical protein